MIEREEPKEPLRICGVVRVSTDRQAKRGESLNVQKEQIDQSAKHLGGTVTKWVVGHEHATPQYDTYERKLLDEALNEIIEKPKENFNAMMFYSSSRWSRNNFKHQEYWKILKDNDIRFFILTTEKNPRNPRDEHSLTVDVANNQLYAQEMIMASILSKISLAKKGHPSSRLWPFGRIWDKVTKTWSVDESKRKMAEKWAELYLAPGGTFRKLGKLYRKNGTNIRIILTARCGDTYPQKFNLKKYGLPHDEIVLSPIPRLLDESVIQQIKDKAAANRTWLHATMNGGKRKGLNYLFGRMIFDQDTGYTLTGTANHPGKRYYRPYRGDYTYMVNADLLEKAVLDSLWVAIGSNKGLSGSIFEESPAINNTEKLNKEKEACEKDLKDFEKKLENIVYSIEDHKGDKKAPSFTLLTKRKDELDKKISDVYFKIQKIESELINIPSEQEIKEVVDQFHKELVLAHRQSRARGGNIFDDLPFDEKREIIRLLFGGKDELGKKYGIFVKCINGRRKRFEITAYGRLGNTKARLGSRSPFYRSYSDNDICTKDYPEQINKGISKIVRDADEKERERYKALPKNVKDIDEKWHSLGKKPYKKGHTSKLRSSNQGQRSRRNNN